MRIVWDICAPAARSCVALILLALPAAIPQFALAQANPTHAQQQTFRNLPPDQQALLETMGGQADSVRRDSQLSTPIQRQSKRFQLKRVRPSDGLVTVNALRSTLSVEC